MAYTFTFAYSSDAAGETHTAQLVNTTPANVGAAVTTGFGEIGDGFYMWTGSIPAGHRGAVKILRGSAVVAVASINPEEGENTDVKVSSVSSARGAGSIAHEHTVTTVGGVPVDGATVWVTTGTNPAVGVVAGPLITDAFGKVTFMLDAGTYRAWQQRAGINFTNPVPITVA